MIHALLLLEESMEEEDEEEDDDDEVDEQIAMAVAKWIVASDLFRSV